MSKAGGFTRFPNFSAMGGLRFVQGLYGGFVRGQVDARDRAKGPSRGVLQQQGAACAGKAQVLRLLRRVLERKVLTEEDEGLLGGRADGDVLQGLQDGDVLPSAGRGRRAIRAVPTTTSTPASRRSCCANP